MQSTIQQNLKIINGQIALACKNANRNIADIKILAATKTVDAQRINLLSALGINLVGENRVQEFLAKYEAVKGVEWHFIGALQTNKVKYIIDKVSLIHSCDRISLVDELQRQSEKHNKTTNILIEINAGDETAKSGVTFCQIAPLYNYILTKPNLKVVGFMPVMPIDAPEELYIKAHSIFKKYSTQDKNINTLSMGMSDDYPLAIKHGATIIRLGSCLFGSRGGRVPPVNKNH